MKAFLKQNFCSRCKYKLHKKTINDTGHQELNGFPEDEKTETGKKTRKTSKIVEEEELNDLELVPSMFLDKHVALVMKLTVTQTIHSRGTISRGSNTIYYYNNIEEVAL